MTRHMCIKWLKWLQNCVMKDSEQYKALQFAINSLETDEAYQLLYENAKVVTTEQVKKALDEILCEVKNIDRSEYTTEIQHARADGVLFALGMSAGIISKHCDIENKELPDEV